MQAITIEEEEQLIKRWNELDNQVKDLLKEKEEILLKLQDFENINQCANDDSIPSNPLEVEKEVKMKKEDGSLNNPLPINQDSEKSEGSEKNLRDEQFLKMTNLDSLRKYFETDWSIDISQYSRYKTLEQDGNEHEKKARLKTFQFQLGGYIDFFDEQIEKSELTKEQFDLPSDQLKSAAEPFFEAMKTRSKVIDLYENCATKSGKLSDTTSLGISEIQTHSLRAFYLLDSLSQFLRYQACFDWDYEKVKAVFHLWEGGLGSSIYSYEDFGMDTFSNQLRSLLENDQIQLTEDQKIIFYQSCEQ